MAAQRTKSTAKREPAAAAPKKKPAASASKKKPATLDRAGLKDDQLKEIWYYLKLSRYFDERMETLYRQGKLPGAIYSGRGQEGTHVGCAYALRPEDKFLGTHRDLTAQFTKGLDLKRTMAQYWGRIDGYTRGRDGNSHIGDIHGAGTFTVVSMLPDGYPVTVGFGMAFKMRKEKRVAMAMCGDGSTSNGRWHESLNWAGVHKLPVVFVVNNNLFAYSTPNPMEFTGTIAERGAAYGMPGVRVDGANVLEVYAAAREAVERARAGEGPSLIESVSLRWKGHAGHDPAKYVPKEMLEDYMKNKDPLRRFEDLLLKEKVIAAADVEAMEGRIKKEFEEGYEFAQSSPLPEGDDAMLGTFTDDGYWERTPSGALLGGGA